MVPKKTEDEFRLIHHLSYPTQNSVNDIFSVNYTKFDEAISMVQGYQKNIQIIAQSSG